MEDSVKEVPREYFLLPVYYFGAVAEVSRERVYAYELYQLRNRPGNDFTPFILSGEVDKRMHILFRDHAHLNLSKPDLLLHIPGLVEGDFIVMEIKRLETVAASPTTLEIDLRKLSLMVSDRYLNYYRGIYIIYGANEGRMVEFGRQCQLIIEREANKKLINLNAIDLYYHESIEKGMMKLPWEDILQK